MTSTAPPVTTTAAPPGRILAHVQSAAIRAFEERERERMAAEAEEQRRLDASRAEQRIARARILSDLIADSLGVLVPRAVCHGHADGDPLHFAGVYADVTVDGIRFGFTYRAGEPRVAVLNTCQREGCKHTDVPVVDLVESLADVGEVLVAGRYLHADANCDFGGWGA